LGVGRWGEVGVENIWSHLGRVERLFLKRFEEVGELGLERIYFGDGVAKLGVESGDFTDGVAKLGMESFDVGNLFGEDVNHCVCPEGERLRRGGRGRDRGGGAVF
jgi:hypothetical protein